MDFSDGTHFCILRYKRLQYIVKNPSYRSKDIKYALRSHFFLLILTLWESRMGEPSFSHVIVGLGIPLTLHFNLTLSPSDGLKAFCDVSCTFGLEAEQVIRCKEVH